MEPERKRKHRKNKRKITPKDVTIDEKPEKPKPKLVSKTSEPSFHKELTLKRLSLHSSNFIPSQISEYDNIITLQNISHKNEENYFEIISKKQNELKKYDEEIDEQYSNRYIIFEFLAQIEKSINLENEKCHERIDEIINEENNINSLQGQIEELGRDLKIKEMTKFSKIKKFENIDNDKHLKRVKILEEIEKERNNLTEKENENKELNKKIPQMKEDINKYIDEINNEKKLENELTTKKNELKEQYTKINQIALNDNKFCHDNFFSLLTLFPYYKNVAFISSKNLQENNTNNKQLENIDENKIIIEEELIADNENENIEKIKSLLQQKEESDKNYNYKILKDRRTLQINPKEKYKFNKIFSIINNNYIAEPWDISKYTSFKLSTINSYFNEFNMTAISNNYFIIYFVPVLGKTCLTGEFLSLFQQLKNNEYLDKNISIKISAITETNTINLQNINQESNIKTQLASIENSGIHSVYGFLYEFIKSNRLNKKNIFRIYNFDYSYPQAIDMMNNISKYYAKKKRKKTGVYKKVIRQGNQLKGKKKPNDKNVNNANNNVNSNNNNVNNNKNNNLNNKGNIKSNLANKKNNANKVVQFKKSVITNNNNVNNKNNISSLNNGNNNMNKSFIASNKKEKKNDIKKILNTSSIDNKKILKKSGSSQQSHGQKEKNVKINSKNNIKFVKFDDKPKSITTKKNNSANKDLVNKKAKNISVVFNDLKTIKPEHTLIIHDISYEFVNNNEFKKVAKACGILNNNNEK